MRQYVYPQHGNSRIIKSSLDLLADKNTSVNLYRQAFYALGVELGIILAQEVDAASNNIMLACASEDADWLAKGVEEGLKKGKLRISVYWNSREVIFDDLTTKVEIAPIEKAYEEPIDKCELLIVVKSIISTSCVVKTQLNRLIGKIHPERIAILAPVMYKDGIPNLKKEFPKETSDRFQFITFAVDDERNGSEVIPGIGGSVYHRLGLGDINEKNRYIPAVVSSRI